MSTLLSDLVMGRIRKQANRVLGGRVAGSSERRIFPGFASFDRGDRPTWWLDNIAPLEWGGIIGVHEIEPSSRGAFIVTECGIAVFNDPLAPSWIPYNDVQGWRPLTKEPIATSLIVQTKAGSEISILFPDGGAFAFVQFLGYVTEQILREHGSV